MAKALWEAAAENAENHRKPVDWKRRMSDHVAYALLVYTGLQIYVTMGAIKTNHGSILPYFALVLLVVAIIPAFRLVERRWERLAGSGAPDQDLASLFRRDLIALWAATIALPLIVTGVVKLILQLL